MIQTLKKIILNTPFEPAVEWIVTHWSPTRSAQYDRDSICVMKKALKSGSCVCDIGAHRGSTLRTILKYAPRGRHFVFEPLPTFVELLRQRFPDTAIYHTALSDKNGTTQFQYVTSRPAYSGINKRQYPSSHEEIVEIEVPIKRLDDVIGPGVHVDLIKIDVEGGEYHVLRGAVETLRRCKPIVIFEHGKGAFEYYQGNTPENLFALLHNNCGLKVSSMRRWLRNQPDYDKNQFVNQVLHHGHYYFIAYAN